METPWEPIEKDGRAKGEGAIKAGEKGDGQIRYF